MDRLPPIHQKYALYKGVKPLRIDHFNCFSPNVDESVAFYNEIGFRVTDACQLRCHTCGQWGDHGYLVDADLREHRRDEVTPERYRLLLDDLHAHLNAHDDRLDDDGTVKACVVASEIDDDADDSDRGERLRLREALGHALDAQPEWPLSAENTFMQSDEPRAGAPECNTASTN